MRLRKLALAVGLAGAVGANWASALGLGEIKLNSSLNQPLDAEIKLLQTRDLTDGEIYVALASKEDFQNAGVDRDFFLNDLAFKVVLNAPGGPIVRVTTKKPVREPYLNFLLQTQWPSGRILREYTLLMDLPVFSQETARPPVQRPASAAPAPKSTPSRAPQARTPEPAASAPVPEKPAQEVDRATAPTAPAKPAYAAQGGDSYGPVKANDTLWEIALKVRPNRSYSVHKTMLAIQRLNPEAFINGNINLLRKGQVLRVPDASHIESIGAQEAVQEVALQNEAWSGDRAASGPELDASRNYADKRATASKVEGRLTLATGGSEVGSGGSRGVGADGDGASEALQNELAISLEELDKSNRENSELKERIGELEDQIATMERLIEVSNRELRALQLAANQAGIDTPPSASLDLAQTTSSPFADGGRVNQTEAPEKAPEEGAVTEPANEAVTAAAQPPVSNTASVNSVVSSAPATPSLMDRLMANILWVAGGAAALLVGALVLLRRRKDDAEEEALASYEEAASEAEPAEGIDEDHIADEPFAQEEDLEAHLSEELDGVDLDDEFPSEAETGDAVAEADIYIAYGKFDQAEEMLLKAIDEGTNIKGARLKLLEVYAESEQLQKFDRQYAELLTLNDPVAVERAEELRGHFADAPVFDAEQALAAEDNTEALDFDLGAPETASVSEAEAALDEFEFNLDDDTSDAAEAPEDGLVDLNFDLELDEAESEIEDNGLEVDLDLDDALTEDSPRGDTSEADELGGGFALDVESLEMESGEGIDFDLDSEGLGLPASGEDDSEVLGESDAGLGLGEDFQSFDMEGDTLEPDVPEDTEESDFDLSADLGESVDLASLDEEMDALSADLEEAEPAQDEAVQSEAVGAEGDPELEGFEGVFGEDADSEVELTMSVAEGDAEASADMDDLTLDLDAEDAVDSERVSLDESSLDLDSEFELDDRLDLDEPDTELDLSVDVSPLDDAGLDEADLDESVLDEPVLDEPVLDESSQEDASPEFEVASEPEIESESETDSELELEGESEVELELEVEADDTSIEADPEVVSEKAEQSLESEDDVFTQALSDLPSSDEVNFTADELDLSAASELDEDDLEAELDFLSDTDEIATKLDLARAYIDMGDQDGAKDILEEVLQEGSDEQKQEAQELVDRL